MKLPVRIKGYAGEHDEAGAMIVDANGETVCTTARARSTTCPGCWIEYMANASHIVTALNGDRVVVPMTCGTHVAK